MSAQVRPLSSESPAPSIATAEVIELQDDGYLIDHAGTPRPARKAHGCLLRPHPGDLVLVSFTEQGAHILQILERPDPQAENHLALQGDTRLEVSAGKLHLEAPHLALAGRRLQLRFLHIQGLARRLTATLEQARLHCTLSELVTQSRRLFARHSERQVETLDATRAGNVQIQADELVQLKGQTLLSTAKKLFRVDGDQIHLG